MGYTNPYSVYKETGVKTASQGKLIVMLYEEAVKQLTNASELFEDAVISPRNIEALNKAIVKTQEIITELMVSLDMERGGDIAKNLMSLYVFFNEELVRANIARDKKKIDSVQKMMADLLSAWQTAAESTVQVAPPPQHSNIDING